MRTSSSLLLSSILTFALTGCGSSVDAPQTGDQHWDPTKLERSYSLVEVESFPGELPIAGIAHDGTSYWLAYVEELGGYHDPDRITVVKYGATTAERLATFVYEDQFLGASGLALAGDRLFLNAGKGALNGSDPHAIVEIDAATGEIVRTMAAEGHEHDLSFDGHDVLVGNQFAEVAWIDAGTYALDKTRTSPYGEGGTQRGIAYRPGEVWLSSQASNQLVVLDDDGAFVGVCTTDFLDPSWSYVFDMYMTFAGDRLAFVRDGRVHVYDVVAGP